MNIFQWKHLAQCLWAAKNTQESASPWAVPEHSRSLALFTLHHIITERWIRSYLRSAFSQRSLATQPPLYKYTPETCKLSYSELRSSETGSDMAGQGHLEFPGTQWRANLVASRSHVACWCLCNSLSLSQLPKWGNPFLPYNQTSWLKFFCILYNSLKDLLTFLPFFFSLCLCWC